MIRHECGLLGIYGHEEAARLTYFGLYAQQHRGQESAGIVTIDEKGLLHEHKGMGLVPDVFAEANLQALPGTISLGHVRYSTTGRSAARNAQPFVAHYKGLDIAIAHNGNLVNTMELREELENDGAIFSTTNDTEVFMHLIVRALRGHDLVDAIREACARVRGAYCLLVYAGGTMVAVRDPHGFHPLALGRLDGAPVLASETCAFDLLEADYERPIQPGEMLIMDDKNTANSCAVPCRNVPASASSSWSTLPAPTPSFSASRSTSAASRWAGSWPTNPPPTWTSSCPSPIPASIRPWASPSAPSCPTSTP